MPKFTKTASNQFNSLKLQTLNAIAETERRRIEAIAQGQTAEAKALKAHREALRDELFDIADDELAFIKSTLSIDEAEARVRAVAEEARGFVKNMKSVASTLNAAAGFLNIFTRLVTLFV